MNEMTSESHGAPARKTGRRRTLVVDNSPVARRAVCAFLESLGTFEVVGTCGNGAEALVLADAMQPDLVVLDLRMPGLGGDVVAQRLTGRFPAMRVLIMTVQDTPESRRLAGMSGAHGFINKLHLARELPGAVDSAFAGERSPSL